MRRMPAEWETHAATWLAWPHNREDWPGKFAPIQWVYAEIIRNLSKHERVEVLVQDAASEAKARKVLKRANALNDNVRFHIQPTDRIWMRDSGCAFVREDGAMRAVKWSFNAWAKYDNWALDEQVGSRMASITGCEELRAQRGPNLGSGRVVLEGGSIDVNGQGVLLTTEECLLSEIQQRNAGFAKADYERVFAEYLGIKKVIWLDRGVEGDDTHGHVDDITRFVSADTIVTVVEPDPSDPNHAPLAENLRRLKAERNLDGQPFRIVELPMPRPVFFEGRRLPASYGNFYIANGLVLVPVFNDPNDRHALNLLADLFPDREVVGIYSGDFIWGFGAMHCMTQQQPA
ncbi:MAG TPA: agmatine deiminase family protein [Holophaga sp.]|nr:agmatine deiminase family protein [Holophaga sp.]